MNTIPYGRRSIADKDIEAVVRITKSDYLTQGPSLGKVEAAFSKSVGARYSVAVANGAAALHIAAITLEVRSGPKILTIPITLAVLANRIRYCGADVKFIDFNPLTKCINLDAVESKPSAGLAGTFQGIIAVLLAEYPVDLKQLRAIADKRQTWIIEDTCHAIRVFHQYSDGEQIYSRASTNTEMAYFTFHQVRHITTGEGGKIITSSEEIDKGLQRPWTHGIPKFPHKLPANSEGWYYKILELGFNYRLTDMQVTLETPQLSRLKSNNARRQEIANRYEVALSKLPVTMASRPQKGGYHGLHIYIFESEQRRELSNFLCGNGTLAKVYHIPVNQMPNYRALGFIPEMTPHPLIYNERALSLPIFPALTDSRKGNIIKSVVELFSQ